MYHIWIDKNLTVDSKVRMYKTSIAMIARHGSEAWDLTPANLKMIRAWNTGCLATITGRPHHEEGNEYTTTFDFGGDIRLKRLQWLGALLRLPEHRMVHKAVRARYESKSLPPGSILMDAPATATFAELVARADDKCSWQKLCSDTFPHLHANLNNNNYNINNYDNTDFIDRPGSGPGSRRPRRRPRVGPLPPPPPG